MPLILPHLRLRALPILFCYLRLNYGIGAIIQKILDRMDVVGLKDEDVPFTKVSPIPMDNQFHPLSDIDGEVDS